MSTRKLRKEIEELRFRLDRERSDIKRNESEIENNKWKTAGISYCLHMGIDQNPDSMIKYFERYTNIGRQDSVPVFTEARNPFGDTVAMDRPIPYISNEPIMFIPQNQTLQAPLAGQRNTRTRNLAARNDVYYSGNIRPINLTQAEATIDEWYAAEPAR